MNTSSFAAVTRTQKLAKRSSIAELLQLRPDFSLCGEYSSDRAELEAYISKKFAQEYNAELNHYLPNFLVMQCGGGISAASGIRIASQGELFLEQYLNAPIEETINEITGKSYQRNQVAELGNLVSTRKGCSLLMFAALSRLLLEIDVPWAVITATPQVQKLLEKIGFKMHKLAEAEQSKLKEPKDNWGSYYDGKPSVMLIHVSQAVKELRKSRLSRHFLKAIESDLCKLAPELNHRTATIH